MYSSGFRQVLRRPRPVAAGGDPEVSHVIQCFTELCRQGIHKMNQIYDMDYILHNIHIPPMMTNGIFFGLVGQHRCNILVYYDITTA